MAPLLYDPQGPPHQTALPLPNVQGQSGNNSWGFIAVAMVTQPGCFPWVPGAILPLDDSHAAHF